MATKRASLVSVDEDCFDMELMPSSNFSYSLGFAPQNREFEFQKERLSTTSSADELFYKGKLLPLQLPPRPPQMPQKPLENNTNATLDRVRSQSSLEDSSFPFTTTTDLRLPSTNAITPSESCRVSYSETNPPEYLFEWFTNIDGFVGELPRKSWAQKLKETKQFWLSQLSQRLKASRAYLKSLFTKSACSDKSSASAANKVGAVKITKSNDCQNKYLKDARKNPIENFDDNKKHQGCFKIINRDMLENGFINHSRRSFSGVIQRHCTSKASSLSASSSGCSSLSSSFSFSSAGFHDSQLFKRSISGVNAELESSIEGAIAHCKQSQQKCSSNKTPDDDKICSQFASKTAVCGNQEMVALGRTKG